MEKNLIVGRSGQLTRALMESAPGDLELTGLGRDELDMLPPRRIADIIERVRPDEVINASAYNAVDLAESRA